MYIPRSMTDFIKLCYLLTNLIIYAVALENGLARTPPMGWMSWGRYRCITDCKNHPEECISENLFKNVADTMLSDGYSEAGYEYVIIDDCWMEKQRNTNGNLVPDGERFPKGIEWLSDYIHNLGLKFGIYENYGETTCEKFPGSKNHIKEDVQLFTKWKADYLKLDGCFELSEELDYGFPEFSRQLNKTGRPILFSCSWPYYQEHIFKIMPNYKEIIKHCNMWRNYHDIADSWSSIKMIINFYGKNHARMASYAGPGHWNDPDMIMIGNSGLNVGQSRVQMAIWSLLPAPLIMSNDILHVRPEMKNILLNKDVIAVDQDPLGIPGKMYNNIYGDLIIWTRQLIPIKHDLYSYAIAFVNMNSGIEQKIKVNISEFGLTNADGYTIMDLYSSNEFRNISTNDKLEITVQPMDVVFYKFTIL